MQARAMFAKKTQFIMGHFSSHLTHVKTIRVKHLYRYHSECRSAPPTENLRMAPDLTDTTVRLAEIVCSWRNWQRVAFCGLEVHALSANIDVRRTMDYSCTVGNFAASVCWWRNDLTDSEMPRPGTS